VRSPLPPSVVLAALVLAGCDAPRSIDDQAAGGGATGCTACHGDASRAEADPLLQAAPPRDTTGATSTSAPGVGAHQAHLHAGALRAAVACGECHVVPSGSAHAGGSAPPAFGPLATLGGAQPSYDPVTGGCAATYCHGSTLGAGGTNQVPRWTAGAGEAACGTCHGAPPPSHAPTATDCSVCHPGTVRADGTIDVAGGLHVDGRLEVAGGAAHPAGWADPAQHGHAANAQGLAGCTGCHGADLQGGSAGVACSSCHEAAGVASWTSSCTFCHGDRASGRASPPVDTQGRSASSNVSVGAHAAHVGTALMTAPGCGDCHPARGDALADPAHVDGDGRAEVAFGPLARTGGAAASYTRTSATQASCAATYCHGAFSGGASATMSWTSTASLGCASCHGAPPSTGQHGRHRSRSCGDCHPGSTSGSVNRSTHVDGARQVGNRVTSWDASTRRCVGCHGSDTW
jgi:predicted CxxxxCH...CXXCH cytochrome family protein